MRIFFCESGSAIYNGVAGRMALVALMAVFTLPPIARAEQSDDEALKRIAALHQQDITATLHADPHELADLWDSDAVLLAGGVTPVIGKSALLQAYQSEGTKVLSYTPRIENIQVSGRMAVEWGVFDASFQDPASHALRKVHARFLRTMKQEPDESWKFTRVMWQTLPPPRLHRGGKAPSPGKPPG
ncbi:MAG: nuclear transport factor 2 family protein [Pseudomonadota bacterium]|jgi:hypothetical protein|nr:nuclear transport factor 2 family protein [Pseudomonadota bacterium]